MAEARCRLIGLHNSLCSLSFCVNLPQFAKRQRPSQAQDVPLQSINRLINERYVSGYLARTFHHGTPSLCIPTCQRHQINGVYGERATVYSHIYR